MSDDASQYASEHWTLWEGEEVPRWCCVDAKMAAPDPCPWGHGRQPVEGALPRRGELRAAKEVHLDPENARPADMFDPEPGSFGA